MIYVIKGCERHSQYAQQSELTSLCTYFSFVSVPLPLPERQTYPHLDRAAVRTDSQGKNKTNQKQREIGADGAGEGRNMETEMYIQRLRGRKVTGKCQQKNRVCLTIMKTSQNSISIMLLNITKRDKNVFMLQLFENNLLRPEGPKVFVIVSV